MEPSIAARVALGAVYLDREHPGWDQNIDLDALDMANATLCILGQLYGYWTYHFDHVSRWSKWGRLGNRPGEEWGLFTESHGFYGPDEEENARLTDEWRRFVTGRREADVQAVAFDHSVAAQQELLRQLMAWFEGAPPADLIGDNYQRGDWTIADVRTGARKHLLKLFNDLSQHGPL